jgi:hypothetical protein
VQSADAHGITRGELLAAVSLEPDVDLTELTR